jgi:hypothetical protein
LGYGRDRQVEPIQIILMHEVDQLRRVGWVGAVASLGYPACELVRLRHDLQRLAVQTDVSK